MNKLKLLTMSDIPAEEVRWLWYPYLPRGKITIIQGDPGEGKTTFVLALAALLTRGLPMPGCTESRPPMNIIYQTAEDGLADTVKPRLTALGADCSKVLVIDESERELTLSDRRLAQAIQETDTTFSIRIASRDLDTIKKKAKQARLSQSDYVTRCCLGRQVVVIEDLKEVAKQLRAIGNNLNQLTALSNMGRVSIVNLDGMTQELAGISAALREIQERGRWSR